MCTFPQSIYSHLQNKNDNKIPQQPHYKILAERIIYKMVSGKKTYKYHHNGQHEYYN